jgi:hypothetical protein
MLRDPPDELPVGREFFDYAATLARDLVFSIRL